MLAHHLRTLEFDKLLQLLAPHASFSATGALIEQLTPSADAAEVRRAQDATEEARRLLEARPNVGVRGARDIRSSVRRASLGAPLPPPELLDIASTIAAGRFMRTLLLRQEIRVPTLARLARRIADTDELEARIRRAINEEGQILDTASDRLRVIRAELRAAYDRLMKRLNEMLASSALREALQDPIITMRSGRYVVPVKAEFRGRVRGLVHDQSASGATVFIEPLAIVELTNTWRQHGVEEEREIERILLELSGQVGAAQYGLNDTVDALARLDLAFAMGHLAIDMGATRPGLQAWSARPHPNPLPEGEGVGPTSNPQPPIPPVRLMNARHPLLRGDVVPISIELGGDFDVLLITGPNTGGKTVALKTLGLLALMAQSGLQIPADEGSSLPMFAGIYADIGDEQSIEQSLSTFSSHVTRIVEILRLADHTSLVLLDEIGAGTDPQEGAVLSQAILRQLADRRIYTVATTHYSELKSFAYATPRVENASVEFDPETLRPTFRLTIGLPGRSNALTIAERLGMPSTIIAAAREGIHPTERHVDDLLTDIHQQLASARDERSEAARLRLEAERAAQQLQARLAALERDRAAVLARAEDERATSTAELQREADTLRRQLRGLRAERERLNEIEEGISRLRTKGAPQPPTPNPQPPIEVGQQVQVPTLSAIGIVQSIAPGGETAEVEVGGKRVRVRTADLAPAMGAAPSRTPRERAVDAGYLTSITPRRITAESWAPVESQLDLRGMTTEEARYRLDRYLNDAYMEGLATVRVVHGKGTGAVRQTVRELLADHPLVRSHEVAEPREGGEGATVVRLAS